MVRAQNPNLAILELAVEQLDELADEMVFVGGCATGLLITDPAAAPIRVTRDVDAIVQVYSHGQYYQLADKLRARKFKEDTTDGAPICRWKSADVILDVMPADTTILGFGSKWYAPAAANAQTVQLPSGRTIRVVSAPYFLITKLEAYAGRGGGDYLLSHDIEDLIAVLDGRSSIVDEVNETDSELSRELSARFKTLLEDKRFIESVSGHMPTDQASQARVGAVLEIIRRIAQGQR